MSELTAYKGDVYIPVYGSIADAQVYLKSDADKVIAEKDAEITELKQKLEDANELIKTARQMLEDAKATAYTESVDAGMRERRLRRALYKACANWAYWVDNALTTKFLYNNSYKTKLERDRWYNMEYKCRAKAEKYK